MTEARKTRQRRANGEESRRRILDAAAEIAGERGYDGTSIAQVSERCGLPASSIYWHFRDKDELIAAVIERSFTSWLGAFTLPADGTRLTLDAFTEVATQVGKTLLATPDFLRLGLMLALARRPEEPTARRKFLEVREIALRRVESAFAASAPWLTEDTVRLVALYALAAVDGFFVAKEIGGDDVDLHRLLALHARAVFDLVDGDRPS
ncbi:helix-turn-helix domain-containing protein [Amycolatopsis japonica]|uniref:TetR/AcrR family transcriptional regulator n=1 Tax=Amycolatopsis japonica TaxID=208439 RepID=UPI00331BA8CA